MNDFNVPAYFVGKQKKIPTACIFPYEASKDAIKNRVVLTAHMLSFVTEGTKEIVIGGAAVKFDKSEFVLVTAGKCFMSEKLSHQGKYTCTLLFFDHDLLQT